MSIGAGHAQEAVGEPVPTTDYQTASAAPFEDYTPSAVVAAPAVVYDAPVVYNAPVAYQAPVVYNAPVYYTPPVVATPICAPFVPCVRPARSTVVYIGGGSVRYQCSPRYNCGSTVTFIGGGSRFH